MPLSAYDKLKSKTYLINHLLEMNDYKGYHLEVTKSLSGYILMMNGNPITKIVKPSDIELVLSSINHIAEIGFTKRGK